MNLLPFFVMSLSFFPIYSPSSTSFSSLLFPFLPPIPSSLFLPFSFLFLSPFLSVSLPSFLPLPPFLLSPCFLPPHFHCKFSSFLFFSLPFSLFLPFALLPSSSSPL